MPNAGAFRSRRPNPRPGNGSPSIFETKEEAEDFITEHRKTGSIQLADLSVQEKYVLGLIRQSVDYTPELLWDVW